jgi:hypothetical protein
MDHDLVSISDRNKQTRPLDYDLRHWSVSDRNKLTLLMGHDLRSIECPRQVPRLIVRNNLLTRLMEDHDLWIIELARQLLLFRRIDRINVTHPMDNVRWII